MDMKLGDALGMLEAYRQAQPKLYVRLKEAVEEVYGHEVHPRKIMRFMEDIEIPEKD